jgi:hypothetical protein
LAPGGGRLLHCAHWEAGRGVAPRPGSKRRPALCSCLRRVCPQSPWVRGDRGGESGGGRGMGSSEAVPKRCPISRVHILLGFHLRLELGEGLDFWVIIGDLLHRNIQQLREEHLPAPARSPAGAGRAGLPGHLDLLHRNEAVVVLVQRRHNRGYLALLWSQQGIRTAFSYVAAGSPPPEPSLDGLGSGAGLSPLGEVCWEHGLAALGLGSRGRVGTWPGSTGPPPAW